ncbi:MAG: fatty acid-binding protein DegV [Firmicutes bacterium HGW-Firmicutes-16]|nr:MAG: fatty acid-binding protein DegV [Firmicutes bacterium HGW-Firmicutes-16]
MSNYKIVTDSTSDLPAFLTEELELHVIPMLYTVDGKDFLNTPDERYLSSHDFYEQLRAGKTSTTTQINGEIFKDEVRPYLLDGLDVLYLGFSSGLSSTFSSVMLATEDLKEEFPDRKIVLVDTLAASMGEGLIVWHAAMRKKQGMSIDDVATWVEENKLHLAHWFTVDDLNHLKRGGRVSGAAAFVGTMLNIKPVLHVDDEGHLIPVDKIRGRRKSLEELVARMEKTAIDPSEQTVFISHGDALDDAKYVEKLVRERLGVQTVYINPIGPVIGSHSGPGTIALFFLANKRL